MKVTNKMNLPQPFVSAVRTEYHNEENLFSATTLLKGVKEILLTKRHWYEIEVDAADMINTVFGTGVHSIFEKNSTGKYTETKFSREIEDIKITGKIDFFDDKTLELDDWKTTSIRKIINKDFDDWKAQGLIYAYLMSKNGLEVKRCRFIAMLKDYSPTKAKTNTSYPQHPVYIYEFDVTKELLNDIEVFLKEKINLIKENEVLEDDNIPPCSPKERWRKESTFAVMKEGRKTAVKVCDSESEALNYINDNYPSDIKYYVVERVGTDKKCSQYCICNQFCSYWKEHYKNQEDENEQGV